MNTSNITQKKTKATSQSVKLMLFSVGTLNVALHIDSVQKIIVHTTIYSSGLNHFGLVNIGDQEITVIDLHKRLFHEPTIINPDDKKYLILAFNSVNELFGIVINEAPSLLDVPLANIRKLPPSYRAVDTLAIASHVSVIKQENEDFTFFILDPDQLIRPISQSKI